MKYLNRILMIAMLLFSNEVNGQAGKKHKKQKMQVVNTVTFPLKVDQTFRMYSVPKEAEASKVTILSCCRCQVYGSSLIQTPVGIVRDMRNILTRQDIQNAPANFLAKRICMQPGIIYSERTNIITACGTRPENTTYVIDGMMINSVLPSERLFSTKAK